MDIGRLDLNLLRVFRTIASEGSVSAGARRIGLSQPAVSGALARLRRACGDPLFVRANGGMQMTAYGRRLATAVDEAFGTLRGALGERSDFVAQTAHTTFTILMSNIGEATAIPPMMRNAARLAPHINFRVVPLRGSSYLRQLETTEADLIYGYVRNPKQGLRQLRLFSTDFVCMFRTGHPMIGDEITTELYSRLSHVAVEREGSAGPVAEMFSTLRIDRQIKLVVPHAIAMPAIVMNTDLVMTITRGVAATYCRLGGLRWLPLPHRLPPIQISLFWHEKKHDDVANRWLRSFIRSSVVEPTDVSVQTHLL
jgi:DNA-binding transcriptional LysR family regulator